MWTIFSPKLTAGIAILLAMILHELHLHLKHTKTRKLRSERYVLRLNIDSN